MDILENKIKLIKKIKIKEKIKIKMMDLKNNKLYSQVINLQELNSFSFIWVSLWKKTSESTVVTD